MLGEAQVRCTHTEERMAPDLLEEGARMEPLVIGDGTHRCSHHLLCLLLRDTFDLEELFERC